MNYLKISLLTSVFFFGSYLVKGQDTTNMDWLVEEWNNTFEQPSIEVPVCCQVVVIDESGDVVARFDQVALNNDLIDSEDQGMLTNADFMFEVDGNRFYLQD
jgi:hypothetical protein